VEPKQIYITRREPSYAVDAWGARWREHGRFVRGLPLWAQIRHYEQCRVLRGVDLPSVGAASEDFDGVGMVWFRSPQAVLAALSDPTVGQVFEDERDVFANPIADTSLFTRELVVRDTGATTVKIVAFLRRRDGLTRDAFLHHWEHVHAPVFLSVPEIDEHVTKYVQNHVTDEFTGVMGERYDGVVEIGFARSADIGKIFGRRYLETVRPDEQRFVDLEQMLVVVTDEVLLYEDALGDPLPARDS
jgi:hypothetical protein